MGNKDRIFLLLSEPSASKAQSSVPEVVGSSNTINKLLAENVTLILVNKILVSYIFPFEKCVFDLSNLLLKSELPEESVFAEEKKV